MPVTVVSRFPEIVSELKVRVVQAIEPAVDSMVADAQQQVPVDTGRLRDAIHKQKYGTSGWSVVAGDNDAWYGHLVEFGSGVGGHGRPPLAPHPFLIPAFEVNITEVEEAVSVVLHTL